MNKTRRFSYIKLALSTILALGAFQTSASFAEDNMENQLGIGIGVYGKAKISLFETKMEGNQILAFFPEQTMNGGKLGDNSGTGIAAGTIAVTTNTSDSNANKLTIDNGYEAGVTLGYELFSPSSEGGLVVSAVINGGASMGRKYKMEFADGASVTLAGADLSSGAKDLDFKDNVKYKTSGKVNTYTIEKDLGGTGGLSINAGYAINESMSFGVSLGGGINMSKYSLSGTSQLTSEDQKANFKHVIDSTISSAASENIFSYEGNLGARVSFNVTPSFSIHVGGGLNMETEAKVKFKNVKVESKGNMSLQVAPATALPSIPDISAAGNNTRYYGAQDANKAYPPLKAGDVVAHNGTVIPAKTIAELEKTIPSVVNAYFTLGAQITF